MPILAIPTSRRLVSRDEVRRWLRDYQGPVPKTGVMNVLLDNVEFSDDDIDAGLQGAADRYNAMTPETMLIPDQLPRILSFYGTVAHLLWSESFRQLRNQATVQDGDVAPIGIDDKSPAYTQASQLLWQKYDELARGIKSQRNMESMFGSISSGYITAGSSITGRLYG